ncbi:MAG TPA: hypothetical protein VLJ60_09995, partial [bacterium]|nr:hypothetical protein [bacterium]
MKRLLILLAVLILAVSCGDLLTEKDKTDESGKQTENYGDNYGDDVIGYRNPGKDNSSEEEDPNAGYQDSGGNGDTGDSGDSGNSGEYADESTVADNEEMPDDDNGISSSSVAKDSKWSDWIGIYVSGKLNDVNPQFVSEELFINGELNGDQLFGENNCQGYMIKDGNNFVSTLAALVKSENNFEEYLHYYSFMPFENIKAAI